MARKRPGPRAQAGPRYPCGRRKSVGDVRAPTLWRRIKDNGIALGLDRRLGSEVGRLSLLGELTDTEAATAFLIAEVYGRFERYSGKRRTAHSPSYDIGRAAEPMEDHDHERRARRARKQFDRLQDCLPVYPPQARAELEQLCCEDRAVSSLHLPEIRSLLARVAVEFGLSARPAGEKLGGNTPAGRGRRYVWHGEGARPTVGTYEPDPEAD